MGTDTIYVIGEFEFVPVSNKLRRTGEADGPRLGNFEGRILRFLIENSGSEYKEGFKEKLIAEVWKDKIRNDRYPTDENLYGYVSNIRRSFGEKGKDYILTNPYRLGVEPIKKDPSTSPSSLDRCECCSHGLGVIAGLLSDRCLVSLGLRNQAWTENGPFRAALSRPDPEKILSRYLFPLPEHSRGPSQRVAIMSGIDYPRDRTFSESGSWVASHYIDVFGKNRIERVESLEDIKQDDALVLLASHQGHPKSREYGGDPRAHSPTHQIKITPGRALSYEAELPWSIFTPENAHQVRILQTCNNELIVHKTKEHVIDCLDGRRRLQSEHGEDGGRDLWKTDYLLITALPTDGAEERRVISFIGLHLTGTLAAAKLLSEAPPEILIPIHQKLAGHKYFQALISLEVDNTQAGRGLARPGRFTGVKVEEIRIRKTGGQD